MPDLLLLSDDPEWRAELYVAPRVAACLQLDGPPWGEFPGEDSDVEID